MTRTQTRCGLQNINADDAGSDEERAAGGLGLGDVDPGEGGVLTDWMKADCGEVGPNSTGVRRTYAMGQVDHLVDSF